jgi:TRAP-type C4-dicarboxylate transport system permease small subunit
MGLLDQLLSKLETLFEWFIAALMVFLLGIVAAMLVDRHFFTIHIAAPDQYARIALVWICFIGFALAIRAGVTIRVDMIDSRLPEIWRLRLALLFDVILFVLVVVLGVKSWPVVEIGLDQLLLGTEIPAAATSASLLVGCALMTIFLAARIAQRIRGKVPVAAAHLGGDNFE